MSFRVAALLPGALLLAVAAATGCSRSQHVRRADAASYSVLGEKTAAAPWRPPAGYDVLPDPRSRFYWGGACPDPLLPVPAPTINGYDLPPMTRRPSDDSRPAAPPGPLRPATETARRQNQVRPLDTDVWESLPPSCLRRMLEFETVREEHRRTYDGPPPPPLRDSAPRLTLPAIVELALINSREYQTQKENLYRAALSLTLERAAYQWLFFPRGNGVDADYVHARDSGTTVNSLGVATVAGLRRLTRTGADVIAQFANDVVLTFNGPAGFQARVGSELLFQATQRLIQRDVIFESLTQAERDVVYAARDFARFRKEFFADFARDYYSLLLTYRAIEIDSQDYFSNLREYLKGEATFRAGQLSLIQVDQFEQNALRSRSNLVGGCNALEQALDRLKVRIGVPPEMPLNLDLTELESLTLRDSLAAAQQLGARTRRGLEQALEQPEGDLSVQVSWAAKLAIRLQAVAELQQRAAVPRGLAAPDGLAPRAEDDLPPPSDATDTLPPEALPRAAAADGRGPARRLQQEFEVLERLLAAALNRAVLINELGGTPPPDPLRLMQRRLGLARSLLEAKRMVLRRDRPAADREASERALDEHEDRIDAVLEEAVRIAIRNNRVDDIDRAVARAPGLLTDAERLTNFSPQDLSESGIRDAMAGQLTRLFQIADRLDAGGPPLAEVDIEVDAAMLTAVTQRYELATIRERLADAWRQIKLRGDDLRSAVTWRFRQSIRTPSTSNRPFSFSFNDSDSQIAFSFDAPLNRLAERNAFRAALIEYNRQYRALIALEDQIKLAIRSDLRDLELARNQYEIAVDSAALASERVNSTRLQLDLGRGTARDFLEAQQAYTASLSAVAREHVGYLVVRLQLFLDLEQLEVDELGFWDGLYDEQTAPLVRTELPIYGMSAYGDLPDVKYSRKVRRMLETPAGVPAVRQTAEAAADARPPEHRLPVESVPPRGDGQ